MDHREMLIGSMARHFAGVPVVYSDAATELRAVTFDPIPWSPHRSRRIWKKLQKRQRTTIREDRHPCAYMMQGRLIIHPALRDSVEALPHR